MTIQPGVWGIDLGQCALKALRLQEIDGQLTATAFDYVEHPKILSQPDADPDQLTREALEKFLSRNTLRGDVVAISVPGQSGLARFVKLPPVEEKKISDIVRFEAKQQIPFNLDEVVWDYQKIGSGIVTDGFAMETEIGLFAMKRDMIGRYLQHFKDVGVEVHIVQMAPLALCNYTAYDLLQKGAKVEGEEPAGDKSSVVTLDIGTDSSSLVITDGERIIWQRPIPIGGNHFTRALTKDLKLTFAKAEHLKRNATKSPDLKKILAALKPVLNDFVSEVQRSLGYFTNSHRDAQIQYMMGLGNAFRLPGLQRFLSEKLQLEVRKLAKLERIGGDAVTTAPTYTENILSFGVAYGLALQGLKHARLITNLLPPEIRMERLIRAKKPWAVAAAAALLLGLGGLGISYAVESRTYGSKDVKDAITDSQKVVKTAQANDSKFNADKRRALDEEAGVKSIVAGQDERLNWMALTRFVNDCIPRPDGKNLPKSAVLVYWEGSATGGKTGKAAWNAYEQSGATTAQKSDKQNEARILDDLIQFNIEALDCRFCDNLEGYWTSLRSKEVKDVEMIRPKDQADKPPTGSGWVVELRGYTFHRGKALFIADTLVQSIADRGVRITEPPANKPGTPPTRGGTVKPPRGRPGAKPATNEQKPPEEQKPLTPEEQARQEIEKRVIGKVSHVVLFKHSPRKTLDTNSFELIAQSHLDGVIGGGGGGGGNQNQGNPQGQPPQGMQPNQPMPPGQGQPPGQGNKQPGGQGKQPAQAAPPPVNRSGWKPLLNYGKSNGKVDDKLKGIDKHERTEFIILFVWQEWTPSDALRGLGGS